MVYSHLARRAPEQYPGRAVLSRDRATILRQMRIVEQAGRVGDIARGRQRVRLAEAGDAETAGPVAARSVQHLEGLDLRADLRRNCSPAGRIMVMLDPDALSSNSNTGTLSSPNAPR